MGIDRNQELELLEKARAGDRAATELVYEKYLKNARPIRNLLKTALEKAEDREDVLHDILINLLNSKTEFHCKVFFPEK